MLSNCKLCVNTLISSGTALDFFFPLEIRQIYSHLSVPLQFSFVITLPVKGVLRGSYKGI